MAEIVVFAGPTLPRSPDSEWTALLGACELRPPAQRGDVLAALAVHPHTLVLLDGYYFTVPSVTHKELLYALDAGVRVIGAASLGALRAAELAPLGMIGVGTVFEQYQAGLLDGDDEVALLHAPAEHGYRPVTVALVEVRYALGRLVEAGAAAPEAAQRLIADLKDLSFLDRHPARVAELARLRLGEPAAGQLARALATESVKQNDARLALELALALEMEPPPAPVLRKREQNRYLGFLKETSLRCPSTGLTGPPLLHAWRLAQLFHPEAPAFVRRIRLRSLLVAVALERGIEAPASGLHSLCPFLPEPEVLEEARCEALAAEACRVLGGVEGALRALAKERGIDTEGQPEETLLRLLAGKIDALPTWWLVRAFCFTPAFPLAAEAAAAAGEVHRCFQRWANGARIAWDDLRALAARLWSCEPERIEEEAARRGLYPASEVSEGFREALELVLAAERLPQPINDWPERREALVRAGLGWDTDDHGRTRTSTDRRKSGAACP
jgi:hypothetical protein